VSEGDTVMYKGKPYGVTPKGTKATGRVYSGKPYNADVEKAKKGNEDARKRIIKSETSGY